MRSNRRFCTLHTRLDFDRVFAGGRRFFRNGLGFYYRLTSDDCFRYGISSPRRFGNAVERNKFRRRIKEILRCSKERFNGVEMVICLARPCGKFEFTDIRAAVEWALKRIRREMTLVSDNVAAKP